MTPARARSGGDAALGITGAARRLGDAVSWLSMRIAGLGLVAIVAINGVNVTGRYFFSQPISWAEEAMLYLMVLVVFSALASVTWRNAHIRIDLLLERLPPALRRICSTMAALIAIAVCLVVARESFAVVGMLYGFDQRSEAMEFPVWIPQSCVGVGLALTAVLTALRLVVPGDTPAHGSQP